MKSLFFRTISVTFFLASFSGAALVDDHIHGGDSHLPRPVVVEYSDVESLASGNDDVRLWCESWRFAGEANNLGPWTTVPVECVSYVKTYMTGKRYAFDLEMVSREASRFARSIQMRTDGMDAWVFDIDETLLSNLPYYAEHKYGLEIFNHGLFDKWVEKAVAPPIESSLKLYEEILGYGFKVFLLTGRSEAHRSITVDNLNRAGFRDWERLILRSLDDRKKSATIYKSEKRDELVGEGYRLHGNSGDQWSDLVGSSTSNRSFKLPNSMYYIP
ncbi:putative Acid phosphatase 1 [Zostera marina]|uniref:Putative Acid phosphatase 1 n=1 Tax=Zostera marina TaxID=29655 RepID=A0A0K9NHH5_ZOSMR|nr:putative Acid phosphatase 1 [Zostera marina]